LTPTQLDNCIYAGPILMIGRVHPGGGYPL
jgi:hypothetical protein